MLANNSSKVNAKQLLTFRCGAIVDLGSLQAGSNLGDEIIGVGQ